MLQVSKAFVDSILYPGVQLIVIVVLLKLALSLFSVPQNYPKRLRYFNPNDLPQDFLSLGYSSIVVLIYDMRY